jgi:hypothetical protein
MARAANVNLNLRGKGGECRETDNHEQSDHQLLLRTSVLILLKCA